MPKDSLKSSTNLVPTLRKKVFKASELEAHSNMQPTALEIEEKNNKRKIIKEDSKEREDASGGSRHERVADREEKTKVDKIEIIGR